MSIAKGVALITGSAQGIGRGIALRLARDGFDIALNDVSSKRDQLRVVEEDIEKIGRRTCLVPADVTSEGDVKRMIQGASEKLGGLDVMVANAGVALLKDMISSKLHTTGFGGLVGSPICGALLTDRYLWWAPAVFCGAIVLAASVLFVGVHFPFAHPSAGATRKCSNGESEGGVAIGRENKDEMK